MSITTDVWQLERQTSSVMFKVDTWTHFFSLFRHWSVTSSTMLCWNSAHISKTYCRNSSISWIGTQYTCCCIMPQNIVICQIKITTVGWPHVRTDELGCLMAQKLDCVASAMCWCIVLMEDKHICSNAVDCWYQILHLQHVSIVLLIDFCCRLNKNEVGIAQFRYCGRNHKAAFTLADWSARLVGPTSRPDQS